MKTILVTGGCGFIGSHTSVLLLNNNYNVIIVDNLINSKKEIIDKINKLSKHKHIIFFERDLCNNLDDIFEKYEISVVIHFAGLKSVNESISNPLEYYYTNINSTLNLLNTMNKYKCNKMVFSSSATIYGNSKSPLKETSKIGNGITNPYGRTKYMLEMILNDYCISNKNFNIISLRYFNPIGAHPTGFLGENPNNMPNNLMPHILNIGFSNMKDINCNKYLLIFGDNYNTKDGTCTRDFIHVMDLAESHILAIDKLYNTNLNYDSINIGLGKSTSVLELIKIFEDVNKVKVPYKIVNRRDGDIDESYCICEKSKKELGFKPKYTIKDMCKDAWRYKLLNC